MSAEAIMRCVTSVNGQMGNGCTLQPGTLLDSLPEAYLQDMDFARRDKSGSQGESA